MDVVSRDDLLSRIGRYQWAHSIDLGGGVVTPGMWGPPNPLLIDVFDRIDFRGKKVLDIGCWDGLWSFEAEKRGAAEVYATDDLSQRSFAEQPTFALAHQALQSRVIYRPDVSVYDIQTLGVADFDVVIFCGVYYHLKHPLRALALLRAVTATGGVLIVEGPVIDNDTDSFAAFFYSDVFAEDVSNWWVPTRRCLREWIECSYFDVMSVARRPPLARPSRWRQFAARLGDKVIGQRRAAVRPSAGLAQRCVIAARAVCRDDKSYELPDADLVQFNVGDPG